MNITTKDVRIVRGQTWRATFTAKNQRGARVDLTGASCYLSLRPDPKAAPVVSKTVGAGITVSVQSGDTLGQFVATISPDDTRDLPTGDYVWDAWVVEVNTDAHPVIAPSKFTILPEVTTL